MPWSDHLSAGERRELLKRFDTVEHAAAATIEDPRYAEECERLGVRVQTPATIEHRGRPVRPRIQVPQDEEKVFARIVVEAQLEETPPATEEPDLRELDVGGKGYTDAEVAAAVDLLTRDELGPRPLEREGSMSFGRARRLSAWFTSGAAGWDSKKEQLTAGPGFRWVKRKTREGPRRALTRVD